MPDKVGSVEIHHIDGNTYTFYVDAQKDHDTLQGIDSIFFAIDKKPTILSSANDNELTVITYNIQALPDLIGVFFQDLNKMDSRVHYLSTSDTLRHADVLVFEEAWDDSAREVLKKGLGDVYPYNYDPVPKDTHCRPVNSGLLIFSRYPITRHFFIDYQDYQTLVYLGFLSNKGAAYVKIDKNGKAYNVIATHTGSQDDSKALAIREQEFKLIKQKIIDNEELAIPHNEPLIFLGDTNCNFYNKKEFSFMKSTLNLNDEGVLHNLSKTPKYSYDHNLNLMTPPKSKELGLYDMVLPVKGFLQPNKSLSQITPIRALDDKRMYQRSNNIKLYNYGNVDLSDHFMVQAKFTFD